MIMVGSLETCRRGTSPFLPSRGGGKGLSFTGPSRGGPSWPQEPQKSHFGSLCLSPSSVSLGSGPGSLVLLLGLSRKLHSFYLYHRLQAPGIHNASSYFPHNYSPARWAGPRERGTGPRPPDSFSSRVPRQRRSFHQAPPGCGTRNPFAHIVMRGMLIEKGWGSDPYLNIFLDTSLSPSSFSALLCRKTSLPIEQLPPCPATSQAEGHVPPSNLKTTSDVNMPIFLMFAFPIWRNYDYKYLIQEHL